MKWFKNVPTNRTFYAKEMAECTTVFIDADTSAVMSGHFDQERNAWVSTMGEVHANHQISHFGFINLPSGSE
jgi:hypothetical protein